MTHQRPNLVNELTGSPYFPNTSPAQTEHPNGDTERVTRTPSTSKILNDVDNPQAKVITERYSFEIYPSQKQQLANIKHAYFLKTGKELSGSRVIREALDQYLPQLLDSLK